MSGLILACMTTATSGCDDPERAHEPVDVAPELDVEDALTAEVQPVAITSAVCPADHVIAVKTSSGDCLPTIAGKSGSWTGGALMAADLFVGDSLPEGLRSLCEYNWESAAPPELSAFAGKPYTGVRSDCQVNWPQGERLDGALRWPLRDAFYRQVGRLDAAGLPTAPRSPVRVALADTASQQNVDMNSDHAESMWRVIRAIACPNGGACPVDVTRHLALPLIEGGEIDPVHGGFYGSQGQLARAIFRAVEEWRHAPGAGRLIINLSVGWEPGDFGGLEAPSAMPGPARAVFHAVQYAVCHGALLVAAAGNTTGDECDAGPLAPAAWEGTLGPSAATCTALFGPNVTPPADIAAQPLVYAVAGVGYDNQPLQNARPGARPRLAGPAFQASADSPTGPTTPLTGSSVAAADVSGIAALVWSYHNTLTPGGVIARLYGKAASLTGQADFGVGGTIRTVSACTALTTQCSGATCPAAACPSTLVNPATIAAGVDAAIADVVQTKELDLVDATDVAVASECPAMCGTAEIFTRADHIAGACDSDQVAGQSRYTNPQPDWPTCSICFMSDELLYMELDEEVASQDVSNVLLELSDGAATTRLVLGAPTLVAGRVAQIDLKPDLVSTAVRATLHITFADGETHSNAIPVL